MIPFRDSSIDRPTATQIPQLRAAGIRVWGGYLATLPNVNLESPWDRASFEVVRLLGSDPLGFCSGLDDPVAVKALAASWRVRACLDVEDAIRGLGPWTQGWLDASGAGVYGGQAVHEAVRAPFHIAALYPGGAPVGDWPPGWTRPPGPLGWQSQGTHQEFGLSVDSGWLDDSFGEERMALLGIGSLTAQDPRGNGAVYLVADPVFGPKRWVPDEGTEAIYVPFTGPRVTIDQFVLDRMEELAPVGSGSYVHADVGDVAASLAALTALVQAGTASDPTGALKAELDALSHHLGVGVA